MNEQETFWAGAQGDAYTNRNRVNWLLRVPFWTDVIAMTGAKRIMEVGCNFGANLLALRTINPHLNLFGIDINDYARRQASSLGLDVMESTALSYFNWLENAKKIFGDANPNDLIFTSGVLIHISPESLRAEMQAILDLSRHYVLCIEYAADKEEEVEYRGEMQRLWRRDYGALYQELCPQLTLMHKWHLDKSQGFDDCTAWLFSKP